MKKITALWLYESRKLVVGLYYWIFVFHPLLYTVRLHWLWSNKGAQLKKGLCYYRLLLIKKIIIRERYPFELRTQIWLIWAATNLIKKKWFQKRCFIFFAAFFLFICLIFYRLMASSRIHEFQFNSQTISVLIDSSEKSHTNLSLTAQIFFIYSSRQPQTMDTKPVPILFNQP